MRARRALATAVLVGTAGWIIIWFGTDTRANWDSLIYHKHAFEYAGLSATEADAASWAVFARYADRAQLANMEAALAGRDWVAPDRDRWINLYRMRPVYPALVAAGYPVLGQRSPMAVSALVTVSFVVITLGGIGLVFGYRIGVLAVVIALLNGFFSQWLVFLTTDGLAIVLWTAVLVATARYVQVGGWPWLAAVGLGVLLLSFTRPTGSLAPFVPALCAVAAAVARNPVWRRFAAATAAAAVPALASLAIFSALGMPGISDVLQENPTRHFSLPDVADPVAHLGNQIRWAVPNRLLPTLFSDPILLGMVAGGLAGLVIARSWTAAPFLAAIGMVVVAWLIHPIYTDANRILSPAWVSLNLGLALLLALGLVANRERIMGVMDRITSPMARPGLEP